MLNATCKQTFLLAIKAPVFRAKVTSQRKREKKVHLRGWNGSTPLPPTYVNPLICYHGNGTDKHIPNGSFTVRELLEHKH